MTWMQVPGEKLLEPVVNLVITSQFSISMHILHTVLYTFPKVLRRRICLIIKSFVIKRSFPLFS